MPYARIVSNYFLLLGGIKITFNLEIKPKKKIRVTEKKVSPCYPITSWVDLTIFCEKETKYGVKKKIPMKKCNFLAKNGKGYMNKTKDILVYCTVTAATKRASP